MLLYSNLLQFFPSSLYSNCSVPSGEQKSRFLEAMRKRREGKNFYCACLVALMVGFDIGYCGQSSLFSSKVL